MHGLKGNTFIVGKLQIDYIKSTLKTSRKNQEEKISQATISRREQLLLFSRALQTFCVHP